VKGQPCVVVTSGGFQAVQHPGVDRAPAMRRDRLLGRQPGDLMTEPQPSTIQHHQPGRQHLTDGRRTGWMNGIRI
jgi:hypothetical protein